MLNRLKRTSLLLALCAAVPSCDPAKETPKASAETATGNSALATARVDLAKARLDARAPDEALALLVSALAADATSTEASSLAVKILGSTRWHLPETTLEHPLPVEHIAFAAPSSLWVSLGGEKNSTVRWNTETQRIESALFPLDATQTRCLVVDAARKSLVVQRAGVTLLCNAETLKPVRDLGLLPDFVTPSSEIAFSAEGLLLAHPAVVSENDSSIVWHLRDAGTGEIIRSSEPAATDHSRPLAAFLDRQALRVLKSDGAVFTMPVSPAEPVSLTPAAEPVHLTNAQFSISGGAALALVDRGPHSKPEITIRPMDGPSDASLEPFNLLERLPWSRGPGIWTGLFRDAENPALRVTGPSAELSGAAPVHASSAITAVAACGDQLIIGESNGTVTFHRALPLPLMKADAQQPQVFNPAAITALRKLTDALAGLRYDESARRFTRLDAAQRLLSYQACDFDALRNALPALDFSPLTTRLHSFQPRHPAKDAIAALTERLARSGAAPATQEIQTAFDNADDEAVMAAIKAAGTKGPAAAKALELALASTKPEWINACLVQADGLPPLLRKLASSRIAWLQDRKADAIAGWPDVFPEIKAVRLREDWDGWEQADFSQALEKLRLGVGEELTAIEVPENSTPEQRKAIFERLGNPATMRAVGRARFARACLKAALAFAKFKEETATTFKLASTARDLGEAPAPCLRAEAMALTALGDYQQARERWVTLITEHPVKDQEPGDYAEAAYTSFENADPRQAMAILTTGLHRFPNDANFALRAGWVALLTGNAERAYRFLLTGRQIGYPDEKLENATALMAIAAIQTGAEEDAAVFYQDLINLDPAWEQPETIDSLPWPEELKASLRQLLW